jgi:hypothetical protein
MHFGHPFNRVGYDEEYIYLCRPHAVLEWTERLSQMLVSGLRNPDQRAQPLGLRPVRRNALYPLILILTLDVLI